MYLQITSRCNFSCAHCCFACTAKGHDMTQDTFTKALAMAREYDDTVCIGGGEPTLHPLFKDFLMQAIWELSDISVSNGIPAVHMVTNGGNTAIALKLADLAQRGVISCNLSQDSYHDPIDPKVVKAFTKPMVSNEFSGNHYRNDDHDCRGINKEATYIQRMGRAKSWGNRSKEDGCCAVLFVSPKGVIYPCECRQHSIGTVDDPHSVISEHFSGGYCVNSKGYKTGVLPLIKEQTEWKAAHVSVKQGELVPA
jgi:hypothetical protein